MKDARGARPSRRRKEQAARSASWLAALLVASAATGAVAVGPPLPVVDPSTAGFSDAGLARLERFLDESTGATGHLGAVSLIARDGALVEWRAYGHRDLARMQPMTKDAIFRIYSMTKTIATVASLILVDEGKLSLDAPVADQLPEFATMQVFVGGTADAPVVRPARSPITLRRLLTHTAGFATGGSGFEQPTRLLERADLHASSDLADFARRTSRVPLAADPGTRFQYDGTNLEVAGRLVEVASGMPFATFVQRRILDPLGMRDTGFSVPAAERGRIADLSTIGPEGSLLLDDGPSAVHPGERLQRYDSGAGGMYSTAADYVRFCQMLLDGGRLDGHVILQPPTVRSMMSDQLPPEVAPETQLLGGERFGLGGSIVVEPAERGRAGSVGAFGWSGAASTYYTIDPSRRLIAILLMQHLPRDPPSGQADRNLPKRSATFYDLVYQSLDR